MLPLKITAALKQFVVGCTVSNPWLPLCGVPAPNELVWQPASHIFTDNILTIRTVKAEYFYEQYDDGFAAGYRFMRWQHSSCSMNQMARAFVNDCFTPSTASWTTRE